MNFLKQFVTVPAVKSFSNFLVDQTFAIEQTIVFVEVFWQKYTTISHDEMCGKSLFKQLLKEVPRFLVG